MPTPIPVQEKKPQRERKSVAFDQRDSKKELPQKPKAARSKSAVQKPVAGNGQRCSAPKCGKPIEQNRKVLISPKDRDDVRHARCAPRTWDR